MTKHTPDRTFNETVAQIAINLREGHRIEPGSLLDKNLQATINDHWRATEINAELLAALRLVVDAWDGNENADNIEWGKIWGGARAAIARAEGEDR